MIARIYWGDVLGAAVPALFLAGFAAIGMIVGAKIGRHRGRESAGRALGLIWPLGWLIAALLPRTHEKSAEHLLAIEAAKRRLSSGNDDTVRRFRVIGAHRDSGDPVEFELAAADPLSAERTASAMNILVEKVTLIG